ncbi:synapse differentiation-inducing gene protein 1-like [Hemitrygon akajei]|uniref:synapse differentiation-inducing gene protein 1-like n=1 Tax=Hemitrygon akajei TaxID=2704970 RepID=UPI003BF949F2
MLAAERYKAMEDLQELQRPLLGEQGKGKPFSHVLLCRSQEKPTPPSERARNHLTPSKSPSRMDACSRKDTVDALRRPSLALQVEPTVLLSLKGYSETTFTECRNEEAQTGNLAWPLDLELESRLDKVPTISIDVEDVPFLELQADHYSDDDSDTDSERTFSLSIPQDHLGLALFSMLCCFWPVGIAAFCLSQKTSKIMDRGDYHEARSASKQAFCMAVCSIVLGVCTYVAGVVVLALYMSRNAHA